jgi:hypothetical protein
MRTGKCPGCLQTKPLVSSHLASRAIYDYVRTDDLHPIIVGGLNRGGEKWMVGKLCTVDRKFPLYDLLHEQAALFTDDDGETFATGTNPNVDVQRITHFALGIFWKASLYPWKFGAISLGPYEEPIRTWLRGETAFPQNVTLNVILSHPTKAQIIMNPPYETTVTPCHTYLFHVPGVLFGLSVGKQLPAAEKALCFYSTPEHFVVISDTLTKKVLGVNAQYFRESKKTKSFEKATAKQKELTGKP